MIPKRKGLLRAKPLNFFMDSLLLTDDPILPS
jgi:hypothetical protein